MPTFVVKRHLPGITPEALTGAGVRVKSCALAMQDEGKEVTWIRSFFLADTEETHCYFQGPSVESIESLNERAQIPFQEIVEVAEMTPDSV